MTREERDGMAIYFGAMCYRLSMLEPGHPLASPIREEVDKIDDCDVVAACMVAVGGMNQPERGLFGKLKAAFA